MSKRFSLAGFLLFCSVLFTCFLFAGFEDAEARRIGGGRSSGSKSFMSQPASKPKAAVTQQQNSSATQPNAINQNAQPNRGFLGGMGGMFGGLLAGGLIGSLLFGGGMGGGMGGLLDIVLIGGVLFLLYKMFAKKRAASTAGADGGRSTSFDNTGTQNNQYRDLGNASASGGGMGWDNGQAQGQQNTYTTNPVIPADFDQAEFIEGAKQAYMRLNAAWDSRELEDLTRFVTPDYMKELYKQAADDPNPGRTELLLVTAHLTEVRPYGSDEMASVLFDVVMREDPNQTAPTTVRELWHFVRPLDKSGSWLLDGIQQIEQE